jgi:GNAT superfamily N-acetyltransferase
MTIRFLDPLADDEIALAYIASSFVFGQAVGAFPLDRDGPTGGECCVLAVTQWQTPIGFATFYETGHGKAWLDLVWVEGAYRGKGLGKKLLASARREAAAMGLTRLEFGTQLNNAAMRGLAAGVGFVDRYTLMSQAIGESERS